MSYTRYVDDNGQRDEYYLHEESFANHQGFFNDFQSTLKEEFIKRSYQYSTFFTHKKLKKRTEYMNAVFKDDITYNPLEFLNSEEEDEEVDNFHVTAAHFGNILDRAIQGVFRRLPLLPCTLPLEKEEETISHENHPEEEIRSTSEHQSQTIIPDTTNDDQEMEIEEQTSSTSRGNKCKNKKKVPEKNSTSSKSREQSSSSKPKSKRNKKQRPGPRQIKIVTGQQGLDKERIKDILVYDVPSDWTEEKILYQMQPWGKVIHLFSKIQRKYQTIRVRVEMADIPFQAYQRGEWMVSLGGIPVRWFPAEYTLKERKQREKFVAVIKNIPDTMTATNLFQGSFNAFLVTANVKAFKILKLFDGSSKLLGYFENFDKMKEALNNQQNWGNNFLSWETQEPPRTYRKNTQNSKGSAFTNNKTKQPQNQNSKKKTCPSEKRNHNHVIPSEKKQELRKLLAEILNSVF